MGEIQEGMKDTALSLRLRNREDRTDEFYIDNEQK
jgi:hypothetical protein